MIREPKSADEIAALINESLHADESLRGIEIVVVRLPARENGCNWIARQKITGLNPSPASARLIEDLVHNAQRFFNLFDTH